MATTTAARRRARAASSPGAFGRYLGNSIVFTLLLAVSILMLIPLVWTLSTSLRLPRESFTLPPQWLPTDFRTDNYRQVFTRVPFWHYFLNSALVAGAVVLGQLATCSMAAYAFARLRFPGRGILFAIILSALMIPIQATIIPVFVEIKYLHLNNSLWSLILPGVTSAFGVFLLRQYFLTIPNELEDAARIDGANQWQIFSRVMLPLVAPALAVLAILTFNGYWNEYFRPLIFLATPDRYTLPVGLVNLRGQFGSGSIAIVLAGVVLSLIPVLVLYVFAQKYLIEGITVGGVKG
jgi:multiple sugar transport system permease protein